MKTVLKVLQFPTSNYNILLQWFKKKKKHLGINIKTDGFTNGAE